MNFPNTNRNTQARIYCDLTERLEAADAECIALVSIGGSFCLDEFIANSCLPVVDILTPLRQHLEKCSIRNLDLSALKLQWKQKYMA